MTYLATKSFIVHTYHICLHHCVNRLLVQFITLSTAAGLKAITLPSGSKTWESCKGNTWDGTVLACNYAYWYHVNYLLQLVRLSIWPAVQTNHFHTHACFLACTVVPWGQQQTIVQWQHDATASTTSHTQQWLAHNTAPCMLLHMSYYK